MIKTKAMCDRCNKEDEVNANYGLPNGWIKAEIKIDGVVKIKKDFCDKKCLMKYIDLQM